MLTVLFYKTHPERRLASAQARVLIHGCFGGELESFGDGAAHGKDSGQTGEEM